MLDLIRGIVKCQSGATAVEYGLIASLIVIAMMSALGTLATSSTGMWNKVSNNVVSAGK
jgi:pilus assembly protein Flp/PilA